jgi:hypothetical protein
MTREAKEMIQSIKSFHVDADKFFFVSGGILLFLLATFQLLGQSADYSEYLIFLQRGPIPVGNFPNEPSARILRLLVNGNAYLFFAIYAAIGISGKLYAIYDLSKYVYLSFLAYLGMYFLLHDYTQIRVGAAGALFLWSMKDLADGNWKKYALKTALAVMLHYSALIMIPVFLCSRYVRNIWFVVMPFLGLVLVICHVDLLKWLLALLSYSEALLTLFNLKKGHPGTVEILNLISISHLLFFCVISLAVSRLDALDLELYKVFSISLFLFFTLSLLKMPVVAFRISEFLNVTLVLLLPNAVSYFKDKQAISMALIGYFMLYAYHLVINVKVIPTLAEYFSIFSHGGL